MVFEEDKLYIFCILGWECYKKGATRIMERTTDRAPLWCYVTILEVWVNVRETGVIFKQQPSASFSFERWDYY